jgi:hypothetical protein
VKKLLQILERVKPAGVVCGARFSDYQKYFPGPNWEKRKEKNLYLVSMISCLLQTLDYAAKGYPDEKIMVIYDRKDKYHSVALEAFDYVSSRHKHGKALISIAPGSWENFIALQPADLIAFDGFKALGSRYANADADLRKSMQKMIGKGIPLGVGGFGPELFSILREVQDKGLALQNNAEEE